MLLSFWRKKLDESFYKSQVHKLILTYERSSIHFTLFSSSTSAYVEIYPKDPSIFYDSN